MTRRYFSLFEMIIVVMIIAFIVGMALVQMDSLIPTARLEKQTRETANLMELAMTQSAIEGKSLAIVFNSIDRTMNLEIHLEDDEDYFDFTFEELEAMKLYTMTWPESIKLSTLEVDRLDDMDVADERIIFFPEGSCEGAKIFWQDSSGWSQTIEIWPLLGRVDVQPLEQGYVY